MTESLKLSSRQRTLFESIAKRSQPLSQIYLGTLHVLADESNPDRLALAAHGLRELMDNLPRYLDLEIKVSNTRLGDKVSSLISAWDNTASKSTRRSTAGWAGEIDIPLKKFFSKFEEFYSWYKQQRPQRSVTIKRVLRTFDVMPVPLPTPLEELRVKEWSFLHDYFTNVLHHSSQSSLDEFMQWMGAIETFLLDRLQPRTFEDFTLIDAIIQEGEAHD